jgi:hypothetical protein
MLGQIYLKPGHPRSDLWDAVRSPRSVVLKFRTHEERASFDSGSWWKSNATVYPTLTRMYWDISSIPMMSAESERFFTSGYALDVHSETDLRNGLKVDII